MPGGTGTPVVSTPYAPRTTREELRLELAGSNYLDGLFTGIAEDDGTNVQLTNLLVDGSYDGLKDSAYDSERFGNSRIYIPEQAPNPAEEHQIFNYDPYVGAITPGNRYQNIPTSGITKYEIHSHGLTVAQLHAAINFACENAYYYDTIVLPGLMYDIDQEDVWTANGAGITEEILVDNDGKKSLHTVNSVDDAYVYSADLRVVPNRGYAFYITLDRLIAGSFDIQFWNSTAGTQITTINPTIAPQISEGTPRRYLTASVQIPDGCYSVQIRIVGTTATAEAYWREWGFRRLGDNLDLPVWMTDPFKQIVGPGIQQLAADNGNYIGGLVPESAPYGPEGLTLPDSGFYGRVFVSVQRPFGELTSDTDTIPTDAKGWILQGAIAQCYKALSRPRAVDASTYARLYTEEHRKWLKMCSVKQPERKYGHPNWSKR
jgi:hypothetical protein